MQTDNPQLPVRSDQIELLIVALNKAQMAMQSPKKDSVNPHFQSTYADLASDWDACRKPLTENGLAIIQTTHLLTAGTMVLRTWLCHTSGQWISGDYVLAPQKNDPQGMKSAVTYARRTALEAIVGLAAVDDDGNAATSTRLTSPARQATKPTQTHQHQAETPPRADYAKKAGWENEPATEPQRKRLWAMSKDAGYDEAQLRDVIYTMTQKESTRDLTKGEVQALFKEFENVLKKPAAK